MTLLDIKQIQQSTALDGYVTRYNKTSDLWEIGDKIGASPSTFDKNQTPSVTSSDEDPTNVVLSSKPIGFGYVSVRVNGIAYTLGDGAKTSDCYFSDDGGTTAKVLTSIEVGDELYWNGSIAGFELGGNDRIDLVYDDGNVNVSPATGSLILIEKKIVAAAVSDVTFTGLNGDSDSVYYLEIRIANNGTVCLYEMEPNGSNANCSSFGTYAEAIATYNRTGYAANIVIGRARDASSNYLARIIFYASKSAGGANINRYTFCMGSEVGNGFSRAYNYYGRWNDNSTNLTSLEINDGGAAGNQIGAGSELVLYKLKQS
jgi:hypothetical protein